MIKRLNNKGNTLAIVLIGIFILSILGTLILGVTSTNYNMKLNDKKSEMVFYYSEKAADLLYTEIGNEVMECVRNSYSDVLENSISSASGTYTYNSKEELTKAFKEQYINGKSGEFNGIKDLYPSAEADIDTVLGRFLGYISSSAPNYTFNIKKLDDGTNKTEIVYEEITDPVTGNPVLNNIKINDVCIECTANSTGNYTNIVTDFLIKIPSIDIDFTDTRTSISTENLYSYAIIAQGKDVTADTSVLNVKSGKIANVLGDVYVGAGVGDTVNGSNVTSVLVEANAKLNCAAQVLYSEGRFIIKEGEVALDSKTGVGAFDKNTLQFYANNISTEDDTATSGSGNSSITVNGNIIVRDDLEVNADNSKVNMTGNYFGYGYRGSFGTDITGTYNFIEDSTNSTVTDIANSDPFVSYEHLESSAIIINAKSADVNLAGLKNLLVAGRAYIDLDENSSINTSYMTGESISVKGNQVAYQADKMKDKGFSLEYLPSDLESGMSFTSLQSKMGADNYYANLGLDASKVIAKKVNGKVYFYVKPSEPAAQTSYYETMMSAPHPIRNELRNVYKGMNLKLMLPESSVSNIYTVGTHFTYNVNDFVHYPEHTMKAINSTTTGTLGFENLLDDINTRKDCLLPTLVNPDAESDKYLGMDITDQTAESTTVKTPYEYYLSEEFVNGTVSTVKNVEYTGSDPILNTLVTEGISTSGKKVGYIVDNNGTSELEVDLDMGVIVTTRPVVIKKNFTGLILTGDKVIVKENATIDANEKLAKILFTNSVDINNVLNDGLGSMVDEDVPVVQVNSGLSYEDLVEKSNWRKNVY